MILEMTKITPAPVLTITELQITAEEWQLYTVQMDCAEAAYALNQTIITAVNAGDDRRTTERKVGKTMIKYSKFGACDTEPVSVLTELLDQIFGKQAV